MFHANEHREQPVTSQNGLLTTIAWGIENKVTYALEGSVFVAGAAIQWLRDELHLIDSAEETNTLARMVEDTAGVYLCLLLSVWERLTGLPTPEVYLQVFPEAPIEITSLEQRWSHWLIKLMMFSKPWPKMPNSPHYSQGRWRRLCQ